MAKNEDGFEAGQPVNIDQLQEFNATRRLQREKQTDEVRATPKRSGKSVSKPVSAEKAEG